MDEIRKKKYIILTGKPNRCCRFLQRVPSIVDIFCNFLQYFFCIFIRTKTENNFKLQKKTENENDLQKKKSEMVNINFLFNERNRWVQKSTSYQCFFFLYFHPGYGDGNFKLQIKKQKIWKLPRENIFFKITILNF